MTPTLWCTREPRTPAILRFRSSAEHDINYFGIRQLVEDIIPAEWLS